MKKKIISHWLFKKRTPSKNHIISKRKKWVSWEHDANRAQFPRIKTSTAQFFFPIFSKCFCSPGVFLLQIYQHLRTPECWMAFVDTCKRRWKLSPHVVQKNWVRNLICTVAKKDCSTTPNLHTALNLFQNVDYS